MTSQWEYLRSRPDLCWMLAILGGGLIHLAIWPLSEPPILFSDYKKAYWVAGEHLWNGGIGAGYPFTEFGNWSNLPVLAIPFALLTPLGEDAASWTYFIIGAIFTIGAWALLAREAGLRGALAAALLAFFLLNGPLINTLREGNSTHFVLFYLVAGVVFWRAGRNYAAGLAFGLCATIKLPLLLIGLYFLARRRWSIVAGGATTLAIAGLLSLAAFGIEDHVQWYNETISLTMGKAVPAFNAQSIDGFLMRLWTGTEELLYWSPIEPEFEHKIARHVIFAGLIGGFTWLMLRSERSGLIAAKAGPATPHDMLQLSMVIMLGLVISPLSWTHYYCFALVPLGLYLGGKLPLPRDAVTRWLFWSGYILTSLPVIMPTIEIDPDPAPGWLAELGARTIISAWLFGGLLMIACFARGAWLATARQTANSSDYLQAARQDTPVSSP
jgi:hypothetical protein